MPCLPVYHLLLTITACKTKTNYMNELNEEALQNLAFLDYLNYMKEYVSNNIYFQSRSHGAFILAREVMRHIIKRYCKETNTGLDNYNKNDSIGKNLSLDEKILDKYHACKKDTEKREVIIEFKKELNYDLFNMIRTYERFSPNAINNATANWLRRSNYITVSLM